VRRRTTPETESLREQSNQRLQCALESIYIRYDRDFEGQSDIIDLDRMQIVEDQGHLCSVDGDEFDEWDEYVVTEGCQEIEKEDDGVSIEERQECMDSDTAIEEREIEKEDDGVSIEKLPKSLADRIRTASISGIDETATMFVRNIPSEVTPWDPASEATSPVRRLVYLDSKLTQVDKLLTRTRRLKMIYAFAFYHEYRTQLLTFWKGRNSSVGDPENAKCKGMLCVELTGID